MLPFTFSPYPINPVAYGTPVNIKFKTTGWRHGAILYTCQWPLLEALAKLLTAHATMKQWFNEGVPLFFFIFILNLSWFPGIIVLSDSLDIFLKFYRICLLWSCLWLTILSFLSKSHKLSSVSSWYSLIWLLSICNLDNSNFIDFF